MARKIIRDPEKFGGEPHIEGTAITIAEVQSYWRQPGVYAAEVRKHFPELSEAELGAAVTYAEPVEPEFAFVAEWEGPPRRRLHIWSEPPGWMFAFDEIAADGSERPGNDFWDETWDRILLYPQHYGARDVEWRNASTGESVDIYSISPEAKD